MRFFMKTLILVSMVCLLMACVACSKSKKNNVDESLSDSANTEHSDMLESQSLDYLKIVGDSVEIPFFEIELNLSKKAEEKLKTDNETVIVMAYFDGVVNPDNVPKKYKDKIFANKLHLLSYPIELADKRFARFENVKFSKDLYDLLEDKDIMLLINVFSGRKSTGDNLLDVDILQDYMSEIKGKKFTLKGKLIYNDD